MTRREFLIRSWKFGFRPLIAVLILIFCAQFVFEAVYHTGPERALAFFMLILTAIFVVAYIGGIYLQKLANGILEKFSERTRRILADAKRFFDYLGVFLLCALWYKWGGWNIETVLLIVLIADRFLSIYRAGDNSSAFKPRSHEQ